MAAFMVDYPEQVLITGVKQNEHCPSCMVPKKDFQVMYPSTPYPRRLHSRTLRQLTRQSSIEKLPPSDATISESTKFWTRSRSDSDIEYDEKTRSKIREKREQMFQEFVNLQSVSRPTLPSSILSTPGRRITPARERQSRVQEEADLRNRFQQDPKHDLMSRYEQQCMVHKVRNFVWGHRLVDVHQAIAPDILHQLLKGHLDYLIGYIKALVTKKDVSGGLSRNKPGRANGVKQLDARFESVPPYPGLKIFNGRKHSFSEISQWTGDEQRAMVRQIVPVITPLFLKIMPEVVLYTRALVDFYIIATAKAHAEPQLRYMEDNLHTMDCLKWVFNEVRRKVTKKPQTIPRLLTVNIKHATPVSKQRSKRRALVSDESEDYSNSNATDTDRHGPHVSAPPQGNDHIATTVSYNTPKTHALVHYTEWVRQFGSLDGYSTNRSEVGHKDEIKAYYTRTNKSNTFLDQLAHHSTRRFKRWAMTCLIEYIEGDELTDAERQLQSSHGTSPLLERLDLHQLGLRLDFECLDDTSYQPKPLKLWRHAKTIAQYIETPTFVAAVATFVRHCRIRHKGGDVSTYDLNRHVRDYEWASTMWVALHQGIRCRWSEGRNPTRVEETVEQTAWCSNKWRGKEGETRHDHVWVQEFAHIDSDPRVRFLEVR